MTSPTRSCTTSKLAVSPRLTDGPTWRRLLDDATARLGDRNDARRIVEEASGYEGTELVLQWDRHASALTHSRFREMVDRRAGGEPLQYVLGRWGFLTLVVHFDPRVPIRLPETQVVAERVLYLILDPRARTLDVIVTSPRLKTIAI